MPPPLATSTSFHLKHWTGSPSSWHPGKWWACWRHQQHFMQSCSCERTGAGKMATVSSTRRGPRRLLSLSLEISPSVSCPRSPRASAYCTCTASRAQRLPQQRFTCSSRTADSPWRISPFAVAGARRAAVRAGVGLSSAEC